VKTINQKFSLPVRLDLTALLVDLESFSLCGTFFLFPAAVLALVIRLLVLVRAPAGYGRGVTIGRCGGGF